MFTHNPFPHFIENFQIHTSGATSLTCDSLDDGTIKANHSVFAWAERTNFTLTLYWAHSNGFGSMELLRAEITKIHRIEQLDWKSVEIQIHLDEKKSLIWRIVFSINHYFWTKISKIDRQLNSIGSNFPMRMKNCKKYHCMIRMSSLLRHAGLPMATRFTVAVL